MATLTPQQIAQYAYRAGFRGTDLVKAVAIAMAESGGNTEAYNPELGAGTKKGSGSRGLWQIYGQAHPQYNNATMFNPQANADAAFQVYREMGNRFTPWSVWNKGIAQKIIPTLPKFQIDTSPAARSQTTTRAVGQMTGNQTSGSVPAFDVGAQIKSGVDGAITSIQNAILGKTSDGRQREGLDVGIYAVGLVLVLVGLIFLFVNSDGGQKLIQETVDIGKEAAKLAV